MAERYDLAVIGAGPAGTSAAEVATAFGRRAVVIERNRPGGVVTTGGAHQDAAGGGPVPHRIRACWRSTEFGRRSPLAETMAIIEKRVPQARDPRLAPYRLGQQAFQAVVLGAYNRHCAITGSKIRPVLQAAHVRPLPPGR
jgi:glycine/D-amino acid oxidase-like deaminating enzyme